ncbi:grasp-with-spasm system ATP-grasp peptide maturase [Chryseobacterium sp. LC2016-27]|uniref:grasp-with-spasm system ATP-grasp peptide maturase n=1 Tax=Chryseobacterium sp. LC2016-27 TaxID=2897326 RepID=UPI001E30F2BD|nr:grasp-with-spasm system ATP-grasp peptide maturase [Chryseobacterium sp. LC2016-27]MCD0456259.1 grasp-with-spasm system ATP-grasp peptide maturase [Chryseobacterium sp. LC2016-27]
MILIFSTEKDHTTNEVIKWLVVKKKKFIRVHDSEIFEISVVNKSFFLKSSRNFFNVDDITSVWFRRGGLKFCRNNYPIDSISLIMEETQFLLEEYIIKTLETKKHINKQSNNRTNKLLILEKAKEIGLTVPEYFIATNTNDVKLHDTITKSISETIIVKSAFENFDGILYTHVIEKKEKESFFPTFFQRKIEKEFEIRSFYLNGKIWSCAIISQNDKQTQIDYRLYNLEKPNRNVRYVLPKEIRDKISLLMEALDYNCGSIDIIKSIDGNFYFLEVNPIGQFLGISGFCNYLLEKEIADYL